MFQLSLPEWPQGWVYFADWWDLTFALVGLLLITLLIIWWSQQTRRWFRIAISTFLVALVLCISSIYLFKVPAYYAGCPAGCPGWRGYPLPVAKVTLSDTTQVGPIDFMLNLLMLWLLWLTASMIWQLLGVTVQWWNRSARFKLFFVLTVAVLPWALLPRVLNPPQPRVTGEDLRLAINGRRAAEFTYRITGLWVQRLALEDVRQTLPATSSQGGQGTSVGSQICLRGYTYFYIPWRRYRIDLDPSGVTALSLTEMPLNVPCWPSQHAR